MNNKSQTWSEYKSLGLTGLKWQSKQTEMQEQINAYKTQLQQQQNVPVIKPEEIKDQVEPTNYFHQMYVNKAMLSQVFAEAAQNIQLEDFPIEWSYRDTIGETHKYRANNMDVLEKQYDAIGNQKSDFEDVEIEVGSFQFNKLREVYVPRKRVRRSKTGKGNDYKTCDVIDNDYIYCPPSDKCLIDCLSYGIVLTQQQIDDINILLKKHKIYRYNIPQSLVTKIADIMNVQFNIYRTLQSKLRYDYNNKQIILCLIDQHWIILKQKDNLKQCYNYALSNILWTDKPISQCSLDVQQNKVKYHQCEDGQEFVDTWIQDFEAYPDNVTGQFIPYASGFTNLQSQYNTSTGKSLFKDPVKLVKQTEGDSCIIEMLRFINQQSKKVVQEVKVKDKSVKQTKKRDIYIYAHNGANFDSYFYLNVQGVQVSNMVEKGGIMSMTITSEEFDNCNFIIRDTRKFLTASLKNLCKSYNIDEKYCKSEMDHNAVNASNWKSLQSEWKPYLDLDVISLSLIWIKFIQKMRIVSPKIDVKQYCSVAQLSYSICCKDQKLPAIKDPKMRQFIQRANRGGRVIARNQSFETKNLNLILKLNNVTSIDQLVGKTLSRESLQLIGSDYQIAFDATSLYPSAMSLTHASYIDIENLSVFTQQQCSDFTAQEWKDKKFLIECDLYAPKDLQFVPLSFKTEHGAQFSTGHIRNVVVNDIDLYECLRFGYTIENVHQGVYSNPIQFQFIKDFVDTYYTERAKVKSQDSILGDLYKLMLNSAYGKFGQKRCDTKTIFTTQNEVENRSDLYDENVIECMLLGNGQVCMKVKTEQTDDEKLSPHHIAGYILAYSKQIMNNFVLTLGADKENLIYYMDTDSFYIHAKDYSKLAHIKDCLGGGKNDMKNGIIIKGDYLGCKSKVVYVLDPETMMLVKKVTWKGIAQSKFEQLGQTTVDRVKQGNDYVNGIDNWSKSKLNGVSIQHGCSKKLSIDEYCQKYDLVDGIYNFKHIE